jgi:DNA methylase
MPHYWSRNGYIIDDPTVNITFKELLLMNEKEIEDWIDHLRSTVVKIWDQYEIPPLSGMDESEMCEVFRKMSGTSGKIIALYKAKSGGNKPYINELDGKANIIVNDGCLGSCVNQFFPNMMKVPINYKTKKSAEGNFVGYSVYDLFSKDKFKNKMQKGCRRHFRRDSFYEYSISIPKNSFLGLVPAGTGKEWVQLFKRDFIKFADYGYWLSRVEPLKEGKVCSGYTQIDQNKFLWLSKDEIIELVKLGIVGWQNLTNLCSVEAAYFEPSMYERGNPVPKGLIEKLNDSLKEEEQYHIRFYKNTTRIFPTGFAAFKIGYIQVSVNFPPLIAKYVYERYTENIKDQDVINIYDPSAGWGGRIAGAMTVNEDRHINYIGTDPNMDNFIPELGITRYEYLSNFINDSLRSGWGYIPNTFDIFQLGSEVIGKNKRFQKYKGKLDLVFTSPPYFSKEQYSEDKTQSCIKFSTYEKWVKGFLKPTLETAVEYLKHDRYLLWNVADVFYDTGLQLPLEEDSCKILKELGMEFVEVLRMLLHNMPGANRVIDGKVTCKNFVKVNGRFRKYEPIYVFRKP